MPSNRPPHLGPGLSHRQVLRSDTPWSLGDPPGRSSNAFVSTQVPSSPQPGPRPSSLSPSHDSRPLPHPPPRPGPRPAVRAPCRPLVPLGSRRRRAPPSGPQCAGGVARAGRRGGWGAGPALRARARAPARTNPPRPSRSPRARARAAAPLARPP